MQFSAAPVILSCHKDGEGREEGQKDYRREAKAEAMSHVGTEKDNHINKTPKLKTS